MTLEEFHTYQEQTFDAFCKAVIRNESMDAHRELAAEARQEVSMSTLSADELLSLSAEDTYNLYRKTYYVGNSICCKHQCTHHNYYKRQGRTRLYCLSGV